MARRDRGRGGALTPFRFLALGDSYTICTGATSAAQRWPNIVAAHLEGALGRPVEVTNLGVNGHTTADVIAHQLPRLGDAEWDLVTILVGVNDQYAGDSVDAYAIALARIYDALARLPQARVVAIGIPDYSYTPVGTARGGTIAAELRRFNATARAAAQRRGFAWIDIFDLSRSGDATPGWLSGDGLHPGDVQYGAWAAHIWSCLRGGLIRDA